MTQCEEILNYMMSHGSITAKEAEDHCGCMRLASRIHDLKNRGHLIKTETVTVPSRHGKTQVAKYSLVTGEKDEQ